jgi:type II secretory pathway component HofQ
VFTDAQSLAKKAEVLESKVAALKELGKSDQLLEATSKLEYIYNNQDDLESKFEELGGFDKLLEASKISYDTSVGGKDKEALAEFAENESSYSDVMDAIRQDIKDSRKK